MLLANVTVAEHVLSHFAGCTLLRRHQVPPPRQFEPLLKAASAAHFLIDISSSKVVTLLLHNSFPAMIAEDALTARVHLQVRNARKWCPQNLHG